MTDFQLKTARMELLNLTRQINKLVKKRIALEDQIIAGERESKRQVMPKINGESFRCPCGCNMFTEYRPLHYINGESFRCPCEGNVFTEYRPLHYCCNSCGATPRGKVMSISTYVYGFKLPDEKWKKMKAIWDACNAANIQPPKDVEDFFNHDTPDDAGVTVHLANDYEEPKNPAVKKHNTNSASGFEIDITKLPPDVKIIRFVNSW